MQEPRSDGFGSDADHDSDVTGNQSEMEGSSEEWQQAAATGTAICTAGHASVANLGLDPDGYYHQEVLQLSKEEASAIEVT